MRPDELGLGELDSGNGMGLTSTRRTLGDGRRPDLAPIDAEAFAGAAAPRRSAVGPRLACDERPGPGGAGTAPSIGPLGALAEGPHAALCQGQTAGATNPANPNIPALLAEGFR
jgi:hypothetical protein